MPEVRGRHEAGRTLILRSRGPGDGKRRNRCQYGFVESVHVGPPVTRSGCMDKGRQIVILRSGPVLVDQETDIVADRLRQACRGNADRRRAVLADDVVQGGAQIGPAAEDSRLLAEVGRGNVHRLPEMADHITGGCRWHSPGNRGSGEPQPSMPRKTIPAPSGAQSLQAFLVATKD